MRFLRMLSNAAIAGALTSLYLTILILHLNPSFPLSASAVTPLVLTLLLAYGVNVTAFFYALIVGRQMLASEVLSPGWLSVRVLSWLCTIAAAVCATIMWLNLRVFAMVLDPQTTTRMTAGAVTLSASTVVFLLIALAHLGRRGGRISAVLLTAMMAISVAAPLAARGPGRTSTLASRPTAPVVGLEPGRTAARVLMVALDGGSLVSRHQTRIADHVCAQDRSQLASAAAFDHRPLHEGTGGKLTLSSDRDQPHGQGTRASG